MNLRRVVTLLALGLAGLASALAAVDLNEPAAVTAAGAEELAAAVKAAVQSARQTADSSETAEARTEAIIKSVFAKLSAEDVAKSDAIIAALSTLPGLTAVKVAAIAAAAQPALAAAIERAVAQMSKTDPLLGSGPGKSTTGVNESVFTGEVQSKE